MHKLYFGSTISAISTLLIVVFFALFGFVVARHGNITRWGILVIIMFFLGLSMSIMSGMKDQVGTPSSLIPAKHWGMTVLCLLGGLAFLVGIISIFVRKQGFWQISFYILTAIIIVKTLITEALRIADYIKHLS